MKEIFVTFFDSLFLPQGLCLIESLTEINDFDFELWVICCDDKSFFYLEKLKINKVKLLKLSALEDENLRILKKERSLREYYWTITPYTFFWVYELNKSYKRITYIDADLYFLKSPVPIIDELKKSKKSFLLTKHSYLPELDQSSSSGIYCVQFLTAVLPEAIPIIKHWRKQCDNWCFDRFYEGKYGDQKYMEELLNLFPKNIHILQNESFTQAPWNIGKFEWSNAIFFHFQGLRIDKKYIVDFGYFRISNNIFKNIYKPYLKKLDEVIRKLESLGWVLKSQSKRPRIFRRILRRLRIFKNKLAHYLFYRDNFKLR